MRRAGFRARKRGGEGVAGRFATASEAKGGPRRLKVITRGPARYFSSTPTPIEISVTRGHSHLVFELLSLGVVYPRPLSVRGALAGAKRAAPLSRLVVSAASTALVGGGAQI